MKAQVLLELKFYELEVSSEFHWETMYQSSNELTV